MPVRIARRRVVTIALAVLLALSTTVAIRPPAQAAPTIYSSLVSGASPIAYYRLGEASGTTMTDSSANGHHGTYLATFTLGGAGAITNSTDTSVLFTGGRASTTGVTAPTTAYTLEAWIKRSSTADTQVVGHAGAGQLFIAGNRLGLYQTDTKVVATSTDLVVGTWYHVAATWNGSTTALYVNGTQVGSSGTANTAPSGSGVLYVGSGTVPVGATAPPTFPRFSGSMDEVAYYGTALTQGTLQDHYNVGQDAVAPTISIAGPVDQGEYILHTPVGTPVPTCTDPAPASGILSCVPASAGSGILGPRTYTVDAADRAGNESTKTISYTIVPNRYADEVLLSDPLVYYRLADPASSVTMTDASGNGHDGEYRNGVARKRGPAAIACQQRPVRPRVCDPAADPKDWSSHFGGGGYGFVDTLEAPSGAYTLEAWIRRDSNADGAILTHGGGGQLFVRGNHLGVRQVQEDLVDSTTPLGVGVWTHVAATWDGSTTRLFVDGAQVASSGAMNKEPSGAASFYVGLGENDPTFRGDLDEVAYYPTALSAGVIAEHHAVATAYDWPSLPGGNSAEPTAVVTTPVDGGYYAPGKTPLSDFTCTDPDGPGDISSCVATLDGNPITSGSPLLDTLGSHTLVVSATDAGGNTHVVTVSYTIATFADIFNADAPLGYYRLGDLGEVMADASVHARDGEYKNLQESGPVGISGDLDLARRFWGESGYGFVNGPAAGERQSTLEAWVNPDDLRDQAIAGLAGTDELFVTGGKFAFRHLDRTVVSTEGPTPGTFRQVVGVWDGATIDIYVDGLLTGSAEAATGPSTGGGTFYVGYGTQGTWFLGALDEVAYYGTALSGDRILQHWLADPPPPTRCTVPALRRLPFAEAKVTLVRAGCTLGAVKRRDVGPRREGTVLRQSLAPGADRRLGRAVAVVVGR